MMLVMLPYVAVLTVACPTALGDPGTELGRALDRPGRRPGPVVAVALDQRVRVAPLAGATPAVGQPAANNNAGVVWLY